MIEMESNNNKTLNFIIFISLIYIYLLIFAFTIRLN